MLPLVLLGAVLGALSFNSEKAAIDRQARDWARFSATLVAREIAANQRSVQMVTESPAFDAAFDSERFDILGRRLLAGEPSWRVSGRPWCSPTARSSPPKRPSPN